MPIGIPVRHLETDGEPATDARIATSLGVTVESYRDNLAMLPRSGTVSIEGEDAPLLVDPQQSPREIAARRQLLARVRIAIDLLDQHDVTLLGLRYLEDMSVQEVATTLGISSSRVCQLVARALGRLQEKLGVTMQKAAA